MLELYLNVLGFLVVISFIISLVDGVSIKMYFFNLFCATTWPIWWLMRICGIRRKAYLECRKMIESF